MPQNYLSQGISSKATENKGINKPPSGEGGRPRAVSQDPAAQVIVSGVSGLQPWISEVPQELH